MGDLRSLGSETYMDSSPVFVMYLQSKRGLLGDSDAKVNSSLHSFLASGQNCYVEENGSGVSKRSLAREIFQE